MMYPRLKLSRNLLTHDGMIFISIDDNEVDNLKKICNEIFGEENFVSQFVWRRTDNQTNIGNIARVKEYIICFSKSKNDFKFNRLPLTEKAKEMYNQKDEKGYYRSSNLIDKTRGRYEYDITTKGGKTISGPWMIKKEEFLKLKDENGIHWSTKKDGLPYGKIYLHESSGQIPNDFLGIEHGTNQRGSLEVEKLFKKRIFDFPKPISLIETFITLGTDNQDYILDFFSGSGTTAHAVMHLNSKSNNEVNRKFIMVQIPEEIKENHTAYKEGYYNISEIGKERIRMAGEKIKSEDNNNNLDIGFKVFKLESSNLNKWNPDYNNLEQTLIDNSENLVEGRTELDLIYEIMLKYGIDLTLPLETFEIQNKKIYSIGFGSLLICLDNNITKEIATEIVKLKEKLSPETTRVVFKDNGFESDSDKTNIKETLKTNNIDEFITI